MKLLKLLLVATIMFAFTNISDAQKVKIKEGKSNLKMLKGQTSLKLVFDYSDMKVGKKSEADYLAKKAEAFNKKEAGRGDKWQKSWVSDRERRFEPKFEGLFNKMLAKKGVTASKDAEAKYTMKIHTTWTEPGYYAAISSRPAFISGDIYIYETANPEKILTHLVFIKAPGNSMVATWDTGERIKESYAKLGKTMGKFLLKKALK